MVRLLAVLLLTGCGSKQYIVVPVNHQQNEANCIVRSGDKVFLTICKDTKS